MRIAAPMLPTRSLMFTALAAALAWGCTFTTTQIEPSATATYLGTTTGPIIPQSAQARVDLSPSGEQTRVEVFLVRTCEMAYVRARDQIEVTETNATPAAVTGAGLVTGGGVLVGMEEDGQAVGLAMVIGGAAMLLATQVVHERSTRRIGTVREYGRAPDQVCDSQPWPEADVVLRSVAGTFFAKTDARGVATIDAPPSRAVGVFVDGVPAALVNWTQ
jgi:hypothetical protein